MNIRERISLSFQQLNGFLFKYPLPVLISLILIFIYLFTNLDRLKIDTSTEGFFFADDPTLVTYNQFLNQYDRDELIVLTIKTNNVFDKPFLEELKKLHRELEKNTIYLDEVVSLLNATHIRGSGDELIVEDLQTQWPNSQDEMSRFADKIMQHPIYPRFLVSEQANATSILIRSSAYLGKSNGDVMSGFDDATEQKREKLTQKQNSEFVQSVFKTVEQYKSKDFKIYLAGSVLLAEYLTSTMQSEIPRFTGISIAVICALLLLLFRRISGVLLPMAVVIVSLLSTISLMAIWNTPFTVFSQILPSFLLAVGIGDSVHLLTLFYFHLRKGHDKKEAMSRAMGHTGLPIMLTSLTTMGGLLSFTYAEIAPIAYLGFFSAIGVLLAFIFTILIIPVLVALFPIKTKKADDHHPIETSINYLILRIGHISINHPKTVLLGFAMLTLVAAWGISVLQFKHNPLTWFPEDHPFRVATQKVDELMHGAMVAEIIVNTQTSNGVKQPETLIKIDKLREELADYKVKGVSVGQSVSLADTVKLINRALNEDQAAEFRIPHDPAAVAQELLLFEGSGSDDLERIVDSDYSQTRMSLKLTWSNAHDYADFTKSLQNKLDQTFQANEGFQVYVTGMITLFTRTIDAAIRSMANSYIIALVIVSILMILLIGHVKIGSLAMLPNLFPILLGLGLMGLTGKHLDLSSILVGSIAIGLSVDDTIHFMHNFRRFYDEYQDPVKAIEYTLKTTGRAMLFTTLVLTTGFLVFALSEMNNLVNFGVVTGFVLFMALLADILLAPALMILVTRKS